MTGQPLRYVAIGDSLSEGIGDEPWPDGTPRGWTDRLAALLAAHRGEVDYANLAVRGLRAHEVLATQVGPALAMEPDVVTLTAGMNDLLRPRFDAATLRATLAEIVAPFTAKGARLVVVPIPDIRSVSPAGRLLARRRVVLNEIYTWLSTEHGMEPPAVTTGTIFEDRRAWADDRLHLSPLGHERLAMAAADALDVPGVDAWAPVPQGDPPRRSVRTEAVWVREHVGPWVGRRLTGRSSGDGVAAKRPDLTGWQPPA
ncbi:SGNH/GDSL hydrolase family protein [Janibacter sp. YB324]|uniref:SGNH/GDSL hydrolase family protein n=1 Tax=Janibacter sp. YB324 TaxID=2761047 RepID=UPI001629CDD2|nr:SGNH/GDSL hydrolase family protein [Janibacter sp. YB324]QNF95382.1 SGNH/GDSL hydrolase family protein [Janibacter sp. YB324]